MKYMELKNSILMRRAGGRRLLGKAVCRNTTRWTRTATMPSAYERWLEIRDAMRNHHPMPVPDPIIDRIQEQAFPREPWHVHVYIDEPTVIVRIEAQEIMWNQEMVEREAPDILEFYGWPESCTFVINRLWTSTHTSWSGGAPIEVVQEVEHERLQAFMEEGLGLSVEDAAYVWEE